jgi:hypothetical protein
LIATVVSGSLSKGKDWAKVWLESEQYRKVSQEVDELVAECAAKPPSFEEDGKEYAASSATQYKLVIQRTNLAMWRSTDVRLPSFTFLVSLEKKADLFDFSPFLVS